jgi:MarR family transcriptional regulator, organic hydroperoxide resistance regulator
MQNRYMDKQTGPCGLLRHLIELVDCGALHVYRAMHMADLKPRCIPVMRAPAAGSAIVTAITRTNPLTQAVFSQMEAPMQADGMVEKYYLPDAGQSGLLLTHAVQQLPQQPQRHWQTTFNAIDGLEADIGHRLRAILADTVAAMQGQYVCQHLQQASELTDSDKAEPA